MCQACALVMASHNSPLTALSSMRDRGASAQILIPLLIGVCAFALFQIRGSLKHMLKQHMLHADSKRRCSTGASAGRWAPAWAALLAPDLGAGVLCSLSVMAASRLAHRFGLGAFPSHQDRLCDRGSSCPSSPPRRGIADQHVVLRQWRLA